MTPLSGFSVNNLDGYLYLSIIISVFLTGTGLVIAFSHYLAKYALIPLLDKAFNKRQTSLSKILLSNRLLHRMVYLIPAFIINHFSYVFNFKSSNLTLLFSGLVEDICHVYIVIGIAFVLSALLNCINDAYTLSSISKSKPIKSYLQVVKIIIFAITATLVASTIFNRSPGYFFAGAATTTALIALVFKDSIMGFIASIQLAAYDMVRIGDWIEMTNFGADGDVIEISLNTVKVQNADKTIVTIPSYALLTSGLKNWRGMYEAGGRRVKRDIHIDINSIKLSDENFNKKIGALDKLSNTVLEKMVTSKKTLTNLSLLRAYLTAYLKQHPDVHQEMKISIRHQQASPANFLLEIYFFTNQTASEKYEAIQADIMEYVYALLPHFDLQVLQNSNA